MTNTKSKLRLCVDLETSGFLPEVKYIWCMVAINADTGEVHSFSDYDDQLPSLQEGLLFISKADLVFGHNIIGYDLPVLKHLLGFSLPDTVQVIDTWILSQLLQYKRKHKHGLEGWGGVLGFPKLEFSDFEKYTQEMLTYCIRDVELNVKVYHNLTKTASRMIAKNPLLKLGITTEMEFQALEAEIRLKGWKFDLPAAEALATDIIGKMKAIADVLEPKIGLQLIKLDGDEVKTPAWRKDGFYTVHTVKHFGYTQESGRDERPIEGPYCRIEFAQGKMGSHEVVKAYLYSIGWVPDEWNVEKINNKWVNKSPKLTESSLMKLGPEAMLISEYNTLQSRKGIVEGWIQSVKDSPDGRLHGKMWTIGTPTFRCRHEVVANIPKVKTIYGKEMRGLFICEEGTSIVGSDSAGNQMRGLCHYIGDDKFTETVVHGDVHQRNADILSGVFPCDRDNAKPWLYAYLFGAAAPKLGFILTGKSNAKIGKASAELFENSMPGLKKIRDKLKDEYDKSAAAFGSSDAFIRGIDGRIIFASSPHQILNYLLQTLEGITCKAAAVYMKKKLIEEGIHFYFSLHYHDEFAVVCKDEDAERVAELAVEAFTEAPKQFGVMCMNGAAHIGKKYSEVH